MSLTEENKESLDQIFATSQQKLRVDLKIALQNEIEPIKQDLREIRKETNELMTFLEKDA